MTFRPTKILPKVLISLTSFALGLYLFEYFGTKILENKMGAEYYANVDHYPKPNQKGFNEDGIRTYKNCPVSSFNKDSFNIIFLGDSFTMGLLAEHGSGDVAFPFQVNRLMEVQGVSPTPRVANFGWTSSSPVLDYRRLVLLGHKYNPRLVILCLDISDFYDDVSYKYLLVDQNAFSPTRYLMERWLLTPYWTNIKNRLGFKLDIPDEQYFIVNQPLTKSQKYIEETEKNIRLIYQFCRENLRIPFVLILLPRGIQYSKDESPNDSITLGGFYTPMGPYVLEPVRWLERYKKTIPFPAYSLLEDFKNSNVFPTCFQNDPHYNRKGHRVAGEAIFRILQRLSKEGSIDLKFPDSEPDPSSSLLAKAQRSQR